MHSLLATLRQTPQPTPAQFLAAHPGCWIQYYDDTDTKDPSKAFSTPYFNAAVMRRKQHERCAVCFSLQAFGNGRTKEGLRCYRNLGADVDLVAPHERRRPSTEDIDRRKDEYLRRRLLPFPLRPHWLTETRHGFHVVFRIQPLRDEARIRSAATVNRRLVSALGGDENAALLTQVLRVPGTYQFKGPPPPFLCRLLLDHASRIAPYDIETVRSVLDALQVFHGTGEDRPAEGAATLAGACGKPPTWREGLSGVPRGFRNATAASIVGGILGRLPEDFWETAGWGGLKEWNQRNPVPLPERELRCVFENIARRERAGRGRPGHVAASELPGKITICVDVWTERSDAAPTMTGRFSSPLRP